jgi:hypothetical protein
MMAAAEAQTGQGPIAPETLDSMGAWSEHGATAWLPREFYATRGLARQLFDAEAGPFGVDWPRIRVLARHVRCDLTRDRDAGRWVECESDAPGAVAVWRCEAPSREGSQR